MLNDLTHSKFPTAVAALRADGERGESFGNTHPKSLSKDKALRVLPRTNFGLTEPRIGRPRQ